METIESKVLLRQLKKAKIKNYSDINEENFSKIIHMVEDTYNEMDEIVYRLERSLQVSTKELQDLNENLEKRIKKEVYKNREKDKKFIEQSRSAALGEMIGNIAHQWRQPLSAISSTSSSMVMQSQLGLVSPNELHKGYEKILEYTNFLTQTIEDFRQFFKKDKEIHTFNINEYLNKTLNIISSSYKNNSIELINNCSSEEIVSKGYPNEITQVFLNILNNARDVLIEKNIDNKLVIIDFLVNDDEFIISFTDNGGGIPTNIIDKIFDPYFTTKHQSQGTGIGLYMCKQIIEKHSRGYITALNKEFVYNNEKFMGACFNICLPRENY